MSLYNPFFIKDIYFFQVTQSLAAPDIVEIKTPINQEDENLAEIRTAVNCINKINQVIIQSMLSIYSFDSADDKN